MELLEDYGDLDILDLFLTQDFYANIITETNRYAAQHKQMLVDEETQIKDKSHAGTWKDVTAVDIEVFLALKLLTGIIKKPKIKSY